MALVERIGAVALLLIWVPCLSHRPFTRAGRQHTSRSGGSSWPNGLWSRLDRSGALPGADAATPSEFGSALEDVAEDTPVHHLKHQVAAGGHRQRPSEAGRDALVDVTQPDAGTVSTGGGDAGPGRKALPEWALVVLSAVSAAVAVVLTSKLGECCARPAARVPTEEEALKAELDEARSRTEDLQRALDETVAKRLRADRPEEKARETSAFDKLSADELIGGMHARSREVQDVIGKAADGMSLSSAVQKAEQLQNLFQQEIESFQERAKKFGAQEAEMLYQKVQTVIKEDGTFQSGKNLLADASLLAADTTEQLEGMVNITFNTQEVFSKHLPSLGLLLGAFFAPAQLKSIYQGARLSVYGNGFLLATSAGLLAASWERPCPRQDVYRWVYALVASAALTVLTSSAVLAKAGRALAMIEEVKTEAHEYTGNSVMDRFVNIKMSTKYLFKSLFLYETLTKSFAYNLSRSVGLCYVFVGGAGVYLSIANIIDDTLSCEAKPIIVFMHVLAFFYVLFFTWMLIGILVWFVALLSGSKMVSSELIKVAMQVDDESLSGLPVCVTLLRTFFLQSSVDIVLVQKEIVMQEIEVLQAQAKDTAQALQRRQAEVEALRKQEEEERKFEDDLVAKYVERVNQSLDMVKPVIDLAAAQEQLQGQASALIDKIGEVDTEALRQQALGVQDMVQKHADVATSLVQEHAAKAQAMATQQFEEQSPWMQKTLDNVTARSAEAMQRLQQPEVDQDAQDQRNSPAILKE